MSEQQHDDELCVIDGSPIDPQSGLCLHSCQPADRDRWLAEGNPPYFDPRDVDEHDCPRQAFLDDPITQAYGVGGEMLHLITCAVCDAREHDVGVANVDRDQPGVTVYYLTDEQRRKVAVVRVPLDDAGEPVIDVAPDGERWKAESWPAIADDAIARYERWSRSHERGEQ